jgi:hypothetical protein
MPSQFLPSDARNHRDAAQANHYRSIGHHQASSQAGATTDSGTLNHRFVPTLEARATQDLEGTTKGQGSRFNCLNV